MKDHATVNADRFPSELAAKLAAEEEKKRKRAEKFGSNKPPVVEETEGQNAASEPVRLFVAARSKVVSDRVISYRTPKK